MISWWLRWLDWTTIFCSQRIRFESWSRLILVVSLFHLVLCQFTLSFRSLIPTLVHGERKDRIKTPVTFKNVFKTIILIADKINFYNCKWLLIRVYQYLNKYLNIRVLGAHLNGFFTKHMSVSVCGWIDYRVHW